MICMCMEVKLPAFQNVIAENAIKNGYSQSTFKQ